MNLDYLIPIGLVVIVLIGWQRRSPLKDKDTMFALWAPRQGRRATELVWISYRLQRAAPLVAAIAFVGIGVPAKVGGTVGTAVAWIFGGLAALYVLLMAGSYLAALVVASRTLGIRVTPKNSPPAGHQEYLAWCSRNDIKPFAADKP